MENTLLSKNYKKLGYDKLESAEVVAKLNVLLADLRIFSHNMKIFHWNVNGSDFFELHEKFETFYKDAEEITDEVAERIRVFGQVPFSNWDEINQKSTISETKYPGKGYEMAGMTRDDMEILIQKMVAVNEAAIDAGDLGTQHMMAAFILKFEKYHWMLSAFLS